MGLIYFQTMPSSQTLKDLIGDFAFELDESNPLEMAAITASTEGATPITHNFTLCIGFHQYFDPQKDSREFYEIKDTHSFDTINEDLDDKKIVKIVTKKLVEEVSGFLTREILDKDPDLKELIYLKIKLVDENSSHAPISKTKIKMKWNEMDYSFSHQILKKEIIENGKPSSLLQRSINYINSMSPNLKAASQGLFFMLVGALVSGIFLKYRWLPARTAI